MPLATSLLPPSILSFLVAKLFAVDATLNKRNHEFRFKCSVGFFFEIRIMELRTTSAALGLSHSTLTSTSKRSAARRVLRAVGQVLRATRAAENGGYRLSCANELTRKIAEYFPSFKFYVRWKARSLPTP